MSIVLIRPNDQKAVYGDTLRYVACEPPFWMAVAAAYCKEKGEEVILIDAEAENLSFSEVATRIESIADVNIVGIFVTGTNLSASTQKMQGACQTCASIKEKRKEYKVFLWGLHPSALPERSLEESGADYIIKSEGFNTIYELSKGNHNDVAFLKDLYFQNADGTIEYTGNGGLLQTDDIPMPAWELLPMEKYMPHNWHVMGEDIPSNARGRYGVISASVGCPFCCSFCAISAQFGERVLRFWNVDRVIGEIERLVIEYNVKYIKILDECFVLKKAYVEEFCDKLIKKGFDINIWAYARVDTVSPELLKKLYKAGIRWIAYGIESGDDATLASVDKGQYTSAQTLQAVKWTKEAGINIVANFMFGLPEDTLETMEKTLKLAKVINAEWINFAITMAYPGSKDYFDMVNKNQIKNDKWIQYAQLSYESIPMGSKYLSPEEVLRFRDEAFIDYFKDNNEYFKNIQEKFGSQYVDSIKSMCSTKIRRKLLGD